MRCSEWAEREAERLLEPLGRRWLHSRAVAERAESVSGVVEPDERDLLVAAAYLHDVGYAPALSCSGFHPVDGGNWVAGQGFDRLASLVAYHSGSKHEASLRGLTAELAAFVEERTIVAAALAYCDLTVGPGGEAMTPEQRLADVEERHGIDGPVAAGLRLAWPELLGAVALIEERLRVGSDQPM
ncbi:MAG TPA: HD domain-containing protein [Acidimicrobiia bacterium]|nr:HD domain-containing protein [Acidimicrobiia bacterium]